MMTERQACCTLPPPPSLVIDCPPMPIVHVCVHTACTHILSYVLLFFFRRVLFFLRSSQSFFPPDLNIRHHYCRPQANRP